MAHNEKMRPIADPYLTQRANFNARRAMELAQQRIDKSGSGVPYDIIQSNPYDDVDETITEADLMPDTNAPINPGIQAFQESGHGVQIIKPNGRDED
jgi:hypothetical protein